MCGRVLAEKQQVALLQQCPAQAKQSHRGKVPLCNGTLLQPHLIYSDTNTITKSFQVHSFPVGLNDTGNTAVVSILFMACIQKCVKRTKPHEQDDLLKTTNLSWTLLSFES